MKVTIISLASAALLISGCTMGSKDVKPSNSEGFNKTAKVVNVDDFQGQSTSAVVKSSGKSLEVTFDKLDNNMGKDFAKTPCASTFSYVDSFSNPQNEKQVDVYKGQWKLSNNHCALYVQVRSAQYTQDTQTRYVLIEGNQITMAKDALGQEAIITGSFQ